MPGEDKEPADDIETFPSGGETEVDKETQGQMAEKAAEGTEGEEEGTKNDKTAGQKKKQKHKKADKPPPPPSVSFFKLFRYADGVDIGLMVVGSIAAIVHGAALPTFFLFFGDLINALGANQNNQSAIASQVDKYASYLVYLGVATLVSSYFEVSCWMTTGERQAARIRSNYLRCVLRQEVAYFDTFTSTGEIVAHISSDMVLVQDAIGEKVGNWLHFIATFVAGFVIGFTRIWQLALIILAVVPFIAAAGALYAITLTGLTAAGQEAYAEAGSIAEQNITQIRTVYSFTGEQKASDSYSTALQKTLRLGIKAGFAKGWGLGLTFGILFCAWALNLYMAAYFIAKGKGTGGEALTTLFAVIIGGMGLGQSSPMLQAFSQGKAAAYKIYETIDRAPKINIDDSTGVTLEKVKGDVELRNVVFRYPSRPDVPIFDNFCLTVEAGKTVALVGSSGSGKSTVVALVERWYDPISGAILVDGVDVKDLHLRFLRQNIGLVSQEPVLFATSIRENILYGRPDATEEDIIDAARAANVHDFISGLPQQYDTQVGDRGVQLSGGQKQRVAIARAVLKNPKILLLDEATSALDSESERVVQEALDRLMVGRTTIVIAHRLSTIRNADVIAVVSEGSIVEQGTHDELMAKADTGAYASLVRLQDMARQKGAAISDHKALGSKSREDHGALASSRRISLQHSHLSDAVAVVEGKDALQQDSSTAKDSSTTTAKAAAEQKPSLWRLAKMNAPEWPYAIAGIIGAIAAGVINPLFGLFLTQVLTLYYKYPASESERMKREVSHWSLVFLGCAVFTVAAYMLLHYSFGVMSERLTKRVREAMFRSILRNEVGWFDNEENSSGVLAARLATDATQVRSAIGDRIAIITQNLALCLIASIIGLVLEWRLALLILATFPLLIFSAYGEQLFMKGFIGEEQKAHSEASKVASEAVGSIRTVAAFCAEEKVVQLHDKYLVGPMHQVFARGQIAGLGYGFSQFCLFSCMGLALWYGGHLVGQGKSSFGDVMKTFMVLIFTSFAVAEILALTPDIAKGSQATASAFSILDRQTLIDPDDANGRTLDKMQGQIELRDVDFHYPSRPEVPIFAGFNLEVPRGKTVAIVGASGSGKSSVLSLIERFYNPTAGKVLVDGHDVKTLNLKWLRQQIGLVQQEPALFAMSIRDNILYGKPGASESEVEAAAMAANAHNFISALPQGYDTEVGERGTQLSGGQKQRVAIARAVLKNPAILLLDEATSALDAESERVVQEALDRLMVGRTTVVVAHRLSTIRNADIIAVVHEGKILEKGTHDQLIASSEGAYASLVNLQQSAGGSSSA